MKNIVLFLEEQKHEKGVVSIKTNVLFWKTNLLIRRSEWFFSFEQRKNFKVEKGKIGILGHMRPAQKVRAKN